jgi:hypothetical protein
VFAKAALREISAPQLRPRTGDQVSSHVHLSGISNAKLIVQDIV